MVTNTGGTVLNLADWAKRKDPSGHISDIVELLNQTNDVLIDWQFAEGNLEVGHRTTVRTGLPTPAWRLLNQGVVPSKSTTAQIDEGCGMLEDWSELDVDVAKLNGDTAEFRMSEAAPAIESMNQQVVQTLFYGDTSVNPERFLGLSARFSTIAGAVNGQNILNGGGAASVNTSIWLIVWGAHSVMGIFPKGSQAGILHEDLGVETVENAAGIGGARMRAYRDHWQWKVGIAVKDWRYIVRIANIDTTNLVTETGNADLIKLMSRSLDRVPNFIGKPAFYCNRTVFSMLRIQALNKAPYLGVEPALDTFGNPVRGQLTFMGIPIRRCDQLLNTEGTIS